MDFKKLNYYRKMNKVIGREFLDERKI